MSHHALAAGLFAGVTVAVAALGSVASRSGQPWYDELDKPPQTPPDATFGIAWTILYVLIALAGWLAWRASDDPLPTIAWFAQMALNLAWTVVFSAGVRRRRHWSSSPSFSSPSSSIASCRGG